MHVVRTLAAGIVAAALVSFAGNSASAATPKPSPAAHVVRVTASNWKFSPAEITVHVNRPVTIKLTSIAGEHGIMAIQPQIEDVVVKQGATEKVTFTPTDLGTFAVHCSVDCGEGHGTMVLLIHVVR